MPIVIVIFFSIFWHQCECNNENHYKPTIDRCSNFSGYSPNTYLVECPPANFMTKDEYECYDKNYKEHVLNSADLYDFVFWCWSRKDFPEYFLKKQLNISTSYRYKEYNTSFTTSFQFNETNGQPTSIKCNNDDDQWAQTWYDVSNPFQADVVVSCNTSIVPMIANFIWNAKYK